MAAPVGKIETFESSAESWPAYYERLEQYLLANDVPDAKQVPALLSLIGGKTYSLLRDLCAPAKPATKTFAQLTEILGKHLSPTPLVIAERFRFHKRDQQEGETVAQYVAQIRKL